MYGEDIDLCYRIRNNGWKIRYISDCTIVHHTEKSSEQVTVNNFKTVMRAESNYLFNELNYGKMRGIYYRSVIFLGASFRVVVISITIFYHLFKKRDLTIEKGLLKKHFSLLRWSLGLEKWVKNYNR